MQLSSVLLAFAATASSLGLAPRQYSTCPPIWSTVASDLKGVFSGCGREAHGAIRAPFHDCINNGCDGSLITQGECDRSENAGLADTCKLLLSWTNKYNVSAADMIQFAAATAIAVCPLGPRVQALVGRRDGTQPAPEGQVPGSRDPVPKILRAFADKGFSPEDVVALLGTHSVAVQVFDDPSQAGKSLDTTPSVYDTKFYQETIDGTAPYTLQSDKKLSKAEVVCSPPSLFISPYSKPVANSNLDQPHMVQLRLEHRRVELRLCQRLGPLRSNRQQRGQPSRLHECNSRELGQGPQEYGHERRICCACLRKVPSLVF
jgi:hypothetical protein